MKNQNLQNNTQQIQTENKMGTMPVGKLLIQISLPIMISMFVQALYNIVDSIFVAKLSTDALTAVSLAFPIQNLMISAGVGTGVGINALLSMRLGQKNYKAVTQTALNGIFLVIITIVLFIILGITIPHAYLKSQTSNMQIVELGTDYLEICMIFCFGLFLAITFERLLQSTGRTVLSMISQLAGAITNIILDPVMIFGLLGFPAMGIKGAAWATVIGQITGALISIILNIKINKEINFNPKGFKPQSKIIIDIYKVGIPSILLGSIGSVLTYLLNLILGAFSTVAIAVYGVYFKLQSFVFMPVFGLNNGIVPIVAYNFGAKYKKRIIDSIKMCAVVALIIMGVGTLIFEVFPSQLLAMFSPNEEMLEIGIPALRIIAIHFPIAAIGITFTSVFQAFGRGFLSMCVSFIRQIFALLPSAWLLSLTGNINNIWWAFVIAELFSLLACIFAMKNVYKTQIKQL
ncbi:MAG: MATE family efflux transporter [Treponema sp.]|nr:MATE family efflux transporter [Spirochaetales bacterium]MDY6190273.1 MATE family efflux transporter [Treponema sp.]